MPLNGLFEGPKQVENNEFAEGACFDRFSNLGLQIASQNERVMKCDSLENRSKSVQTLTPKSLQLTSNQGGIHRSSIKNDLH